MRRAVAVKILKLGLDTKRVMTRFEAERQTLAMMEHPNIAHVLDAGATKTGRPYFVMELVRGRNINEFCASARASLSERLRLFQQVCQAVQHAHQKGIIHRDLKPSNVLVAVHDGVATPKVIDFGIAKAIAGPATITLSTQVDQLIGTPAYMSPEQAQGGWVDVDTRSDIYSLGVLLYELLAGRPPFSNEELLNAGVDEMRRRLLTEDPPRLSVQAGRATRSDFSTGAAGPGSRRWAEALKGDLDWIAMKALEKDRNRRYQTVRGLWLDLERHLTNEPVEARPPSGVYRLRKMVRRNKVAFAAISSAIVALVAGHAISTWLYFKAAAGEREQTGLRAVAERALQHEAALRRQAEDRERITRAAILLFERRYAEADALVRELPPDFRQSSLEAGNVFRELTEWNVLQGDMPSAAQRALSLLEVGSLHQSDQPHVVTRDFVVAAPALIAAEKLRTYDELRQEWARKFRETESAVAAEQVLKTCLLLPPSDALSEEMMSLARTQEQCVADRGSSILDRAWGSVTVALLEYRRGFPAKGAEWSTRSLAFAYRNKAHQALCLAVRAMCQWELGQTDSAREGLGQARHLIDGWFARPARGPEVGAWNDWLIARIILREAAQKIESREDSS